MSVHSHPAYQERVNSRRGNDDGLEHKHVLAGLLYQQLERLQGLEAEVLSGLDGNGRARYGLGDELGAPSAQLHVVLAAEDGEDAGDDRAIVFGVGEDELPRVLELAELVGCAENYGRSHGRFWGAGRGEVSVRLGEMMARERNEEARIMGGGAIRRDI